MKNQTFMDMSQPGAIEDFEDIVDYLATFNKGDIPPQYEPVQPIVNAQQVEAIKQFILYLYEWDSGQWHYVHDPDEDESKS